MTGLAWKTRVYLTHYTQKPFYITPFCKENLASQENYASELHQVMILCYSKVGRTSFYRMFSYGRIHLLTFKTFSLFVWKTEGRSIYSRRLGQSLGGFAPKKILSTELPWYIKWHIYCRLQYLRIEFLHHYRTRSGETNIIKCIFGYSLWMAWL